MTACQAPKGKSTITTMMTAKMEGVHSHLNFCQAFGKWYKVVSLLFVLFVGSCDSRGQGATAPAQPWVPESLPPSGKIGKITCPLQARRYFEDIRREHGRGLDMEERQALAACFSTNRTSSTSQERCVFMNLARGEFARDPLVFRLFEDCPPEAMQFFWKITQSGGSLDGNVATGFRVHAVGPIVPAIKETAAIIRSRQAEARKTNGGRLRYVFLVLEANANGTFGPGLRVASEEAWAGKGLPVGELFLFTGGDGWQRKHELYDQIADCTVVSIAAGPRSKLLELYGKQIEFDEVSLMRIRRQLRRYIVLHDETYSIAKHNYADVRSAARVEAGPSPGGFTTETIRREQWQQSVDRIINRNGAEFYKTMVNVKAAVYARFLDLPDAPPNSLESLEYLSD